MNENKGGVGRYLKGAVGLLVAVAAWLLLAPQQLGGPMAYASITGNSMEPMLTEGDLALVRSQGEYDPGDVVAYNSEELGHVVLHRIVSQEGDAFVMKGDNNDWLDSERPTEDQILGELWVNVPSAGSIMQKIREPKVASILVVLTAAIYLGLAKLRRGRAGNGAGRERRKGSRRPGLAALSPGRPGNIQLAIGLGTLAAVAAIFTLFAFTRTSPEATAQSQAGFDHTGRFEYSAETVKNEVYPTGKVKTGDPIYLRLVDRLQTRFDYELTSEGEVDVAGTGRLMLDLSDQTGWSRSLPLGPEVELEDGRATLTGDINLTKIRSLLSRVSKLTGVTPASYAATVRPVIEVGGTVDGEPATGIFSPGLPFQLDSFQMKTAPELTADPAAGDPFAPTQPGSEGSEQAAPEEAPTVLGLPQTAARVLGLFAMLLAFAALAYVLFVREEEVAGVPETVSIATRHRERLVPVMRTPRPLNSGVEVADFDALLSISEQYDKMILTTKIEDDALYMVDHEGVLYLYRVRNIGTAVQPPMPLPAAMPTPPPPPPIAEEHEGDQADK